jgi:hypothetical protein
LLKKAHLNLQRILQQSRLAGSGGLKGGKARAAKLTAKERKEMAIKAAHARWKKRHKPG